MNTKHCSRIFNNYPLQTSQFLYIQFLGLGPDATRTQHLTHTALTSSIFTMSWNTRPMLCHSTTSSVACEYKNRSLMNTRIPRYSPASPSIAWHPCQPMDASCIAVRITRITIRCLAVGWLPCHPLAASPWKDFIAFRCEKTSSVSARSLSPWDEFPRVPCPWVNCFVSRCSLVVLLYYSSVSGENPPWRELLA
jgi:hypothetical protein